MYSIFSRENESYPQRFVFFCRKGTAPKIGSQGTQFLAGVQGAEPRCRVWAEPTATKSRKRTHKKQNGVLRPNAARRSLACGEKTELLLLEPRNVNAVNSPLARAALRHAWSPFALCICTHSSRPYQALSTLCLTGSSLGQSCSLPSVTLTPTYRRSLISPLQSVINALLNGQLVLYPHRKLSFWTSG